MKKILLFLMIMIGSLSYSQPYSHANSPSSISTCSGTFYDQGGTGNYANNRNITQTFIPTTVCSNIQITFTSFNLENNFDYLYVYNGPNISSPLIGRYTGATIPAAITSSSADGSLTFRFTSDFSGVRAGWVSTLSCVTKPTQFTVNAGTDKVVTCHGNILMNASITPTPITSSKTFTYSGSGRDCDNFLIGGATSGIPSTATITSISFNATIGTNCTSWYEWDFIANDNYIGSGCNSTGNIYNGLNGQFANGQTFRLRSWDNDSWCDNVTMGLTLTVNYTVPTPTYTWSPNIVNGYTTLSSTSVLNPTVTPASTTTYTLSATSRGCTYTDQVLITMPCSLPIDLISFTGECGGVENVIRWVTASEQNSDYFIIERSNDLVNWDFVSKVTASGNSNYEKEYSIIDRDFPNGISYYRLRQYDFNGDNEVFDPISINCFRDKTLVKTINLLGQEINPNDIKGVYIEIYNDGTIIKRLK
jgi:hypothetical protein